MLGRPERYLEDDDREKVISLREQEVISLLELCALTGLTEEPDELFDIIIHMTRDMVEYEEASIVLLPDDMSEMTFCYFTGSVLPAFWNSELASSSRCFALNITPMQ